MGLISTLKHSIINAFTTPQPYNMEVASSSYPVHMNTRSLIPKSRFVSSIYSRIALDVASTTFSYVIVNEKNGDEVPNKTIGLSRIFNLEANVDQNPIHFIKDIVYSMFDEGVVALVPTVVYYDENMSPKTDIISMRVCKIVEWYPKAVKVYAYNEDTGRYENITMPKNKVAIIENPFYEVMNAQNSTLMRLLSKMSMVDNLDEILSSGRLDVLIQLPYITRSDSKRTLAKERLASIEEDLKNGKNGIAYIESTEKVIQLNRPANTQVVENAKILKEEFFNQLGLTENIWRGTASESELRRYYTSTVDIIVNAILMEINRKFISDEDRIAGHKMVASRNRFDLVPLEDIASMCDSLRRNSMITPNEGRAFLGLRPHSDPAADSLANSNMPIDDQLSPSGNKKDDEEEKDVKDNET